MPAWLSVLLEIIKVTVPALIVYLTVHTLLKQFLEGQYRMKAAELQQDRQASTTPMRFQAYERLSLLCERIALPNLIMRVRPDGMSVAEYRLTLMLAIQQEFEHNITQQVYVSQQLWEIIKTARDHTVEVINLSADNMTPKGDAKELAQFILSLPQENTVGALDKALVAIKREAASLL
jgi:hypothetical protein